MVIIETKRIETAEKKKEETKKKVITIKITPEMERVFKRLKEIETEAKERRESLEERLKIEDKPSKVKKEFLRSSKWIDKQKEKILGLNIPFEQELQEPLLFLIKENGYIDLIQNVKAGEFIISTPKGEKGIFLEPSKLLAWRYGDNYFKIWIAYENCMSPYPENPIHNAEMYRKTTQKLAMNWRDRDEANLITAKTKMWMYIIGGIVVGAILLLSTDFGKNLMANIGKEQVTTVTQIIKENATNVINNAGGVSIK